MIACSRYARRIGIVKRITSAMPEMTAPKKKYGGNWVECQPGVSPPAKSRPTTLCTDTTIGAMIAAMIRYTLLYGRHCHAAAQSIIDSAMRLIAARQGERVR